MAAIEADAAASRATADAAMRRVRSAAAGRIVDLEAETARQQGALGELAAAAGGLAEENAALGGEAACARAAQRQSADSVAHLEVPLKCLSHLCSID